MTTRDRNQDFFSARKKYNHDPRNKMVLAEPPPWLKVFRNLMINVLPALDRKIDVVAAKQARQRQTTFDDSDDAAEEIESDIDALKKNFYKVNDICKSLFTNLDKKLCQRVIEVNQELLLKLLTVESDHKNKSISMTSTYQKHFESKRFKAEEFAVVPLDEEKSERSVLLDEVIYEDDTKHKEIEKIAKSIHQVHDIFNEFSLLVNIQGETLNNIEKNVDDTLVNVEVGTGEIREASKYQTSYRKCLCGLLLCLVIVVLIIIVAIKSIIDQNNN